MSKVNLSVRVRMAAGIAVLVVSAFEATAQKADPSQGNCPKGPKVSVEIVQSASGMKWSRRTVPYPGSTNVKGHNYGFYIDNSLKKYDLCAIGSEGYVVDTDPAPGFSSGLKVGLQGSDRYGRVYLDQPAPGCVHLYADDREGPSHVWIAGVYVRQKKLVDAPVCADAVKVARDLTCGFNQIQLESSRAIGPCGEEGVSQPPTVRTLAHLTREPGGSAELVELSPAEPSSALDGRVRFALGKTGLLNVSVTDTPAADSKSGTQKGAQGELPPAVSQKPWWFEDKYLAFFFGVIFATVFLVIAAVDRNPPPHSRWIYRVVLSVAAAGVGAVLPGLLDVTVPGYIRAGGALGLFVVVYLWNPPGAKQGQSPTGT